ncbi:MAG TPA: hypothetical protein PK970_02415 [Hyphomicrobiaceae bacterium]|nr:hypothetical protein [Hyphomicrobiaceae bacterium]
MNQQRTSADNVLSLQSIMLIALGFLTAALIALMIAPAFWSRAVRLTTKRITDTLPITEAEIRADKDRMRAEYAMTVHRLETRIEQAELNRARHLVDLNRRDAAIAELENTLTTVRSELEENTNARRVLEHTMSDRLPKLDQRLAEARRLLEERDAELARVATMTEAQVTALAEATAINAQQASEIERLTTSLSVVGARTRNSLQDQSTDAEIALRSEIDALRARTREQAALIARLETRVGETRSGTSASAVPPATPAAAKPAMALVPTVSEQDEERRRIEQDAKKLRTDLAEKSAELAKALAELDTLRKTASNGTKDSALSLKAHIAGLEAERSEHLEQITRLKAEVSVLAEQVARQSAEFAEHLRRTGAGTRPAAPGSDEPRREPRLSLAERVAQSRAAPTAPATAGETSEAADDKNASEPVSPADIPAEARPRERGRLIDRISSLNKA